MSGGGASRRSGFARFTCSLMAGLSLLPLAVLGQSTPPLAPSTQLVGASGAPAATQETFTIAAAEDLLVTFTDFQTPGPLSTASVVVTQDAGLAGMTTMTTPATTATLALTAAVGQYTLRVIGTPGAAGVGTFSVCVAPKATPSACIQNASLAGNITEQSAAADPTVSTLATTLTVAAAGAYTFTYADQQFPAALQSPPSLALFQGSQPVSGAVPLPASPAVITLSPGTYNLFVVAQADAAAAAGLYGITITGPAGVASLLDGSFPVGQLGAAAQPNNPSAQSVTLTVSDFAFPAALTSLQFAAAQNGAVLKQAAAAGSLYFTAAAGPVVLLVDASPQPNGDGMFDVNVQTSGGAPQLVFDQVQPVSSAGGFTSQPITLGTSGNFDVTLTDLNFPAQFATLALVGASEGAVLGKIYGGGTFSIAATPGTYQFTVVAIPAAQQQYGLYGIQIVDSPPTVVLTAMPTTVTAGGVTTLSWTTTNASACTASGGTFTGPEQTGSGSLSVSVAATTTYSLACSGPGGSATGTVKVTATQAPAGSGGGGGIGPTMLALLGLLALKRVRCLGLAVSARF